MKSKLIQGRFRYADAHDLYALLGVRPGHLPPEGMAPRTIQGVTVYVRPLAPKVGPWRNFQGLRVMAICTECGRHVAAGRLPQHRCTETEK